MDDTGMSEAQTSWSALPETSSGARYAWSEPEDYPPTGPQPEYEDDEDPWPRRIVWGIVVVVFGAMAILLVWMADRFGLLQSQPTVTVPAVVQTSTSAPPLPPPVPSLPPVTETQTVLPPVTETVTTVEPAPRQVYVAPTPVMAPPPETVTVAPPPAALPPPELPPPPPPRRYMWLRLPFVTIPIPLNPPPPPPGP